MRLHENTTSGRPKAALAQLPTLILILLLVFAAPSAVIAQGALSVAGAIESTSGGFTFPDGSLQQTAVTTALTPIDSVPFTITEPGSYYLTRSMTIDSGNAITIDSSDVTLDLMGHTLDGLDSASFGIQGAVSTRNIRIQNGSLVRFAGSALSSTASHLWVTNIRALDNGAAGIFVTGIPVVVSDCEASGNGSVGIQVLGDGVVRDTIVRGNLAGLLASDARISRNLVEFNTNRGIWCVGECSIVDNTVRANNSGDTVNFAGIHVTGDNSLVRGNQVTGNLQQNILVSGSGNAIEGNLITNSSLGVHFDLSAGDNATAHNRWSNHTTADFQNNGLGTIAALDNLAF